MVAAGFVTSMWARNESSFGVFLFFSFEFFPGSVDSFFILDFGFSMCSISLKKINFLLELF